MVSLLQHVIGGIARVHAESKWRHGDEDLALALSLADRAAIAIENARLLREEERAGAEAELASRMKDEVLAMLGHELRNPLSFMVTALEVMMLRERAPRHHVSAPLPADRFGTW